jgi:23S rRNA maturation-related 3'-5' exoribonuclease YhaM
MIVGQFLLSVAWLVSCGVVVVVMLEGGGNNGAREVKGAHLIQRRHIQHKMAQTVSKVNTKLEAHVLQQLCFKTVRPSLLEYLRTYLSQ